MVDRYEPKGVRHFIRLNKIPEIVGKGREQVRLDIQHKLLKLTRIGPRSVGAYAEDIAEYQRRLEELYNT